MSSTNRLDELQASYQMEEKVIKEAQTKLDLFLKSGKTNDSSNLAEWHRLEEDVNFHEMLAAKIKADKLAQQPKAQGGP